MASLQIKTILDHVRGYHIRLADQLESLECRESDPRIRLLLDYMARHEINFEETLAGYKRDTAKSILDTWIKYVPDAENLAAVKELSFRDQMPADEVVAMVMKFDRALIDMYRELIGETAVPGVQELFAKVIELEERKDRQVSICLLEMADE